MNIYRRIVPAALTGALALTTGLALTACGGNGEPALTDSPACASITGNPKGSGPGNDKSAIGVVAAFKFALFTERDALKAASYTDPNSGITATAIKNGITDYPAGISYCFAVTHVDGNAIWVTTSAAYPGRTYRPGYQIITVSSKAPYRITSVYDRYQPQQR